MASSPKVSCLICGRRRPRSLCLERGFEMWMCSDCSEEEGELFKGQSVPANWDDRVRPPGHPVARLR